MKKLLFFSLLFIVYCSSSAHAAPFPDLKSPTLIEAVNYLNQKGIIKGYPDGTFKPNQVINRAEALKIIFLSLSKEEALKIENSKIENSPFPDVEKTQWFTPFVQEAKVRGMVTGYADGTYKPTQFVNKAEFMKIAMLAQSYYQEPATSQPALSQFNDLDPSAWYIPYLGFALNNEFVDRVAKFNPTGGMTRGEAALIIYRVSKKNETVVEHEPAPIEVLSCDTCVNGVDLSQYEWSKLSFVKIENGKLWIDGYDETSSITVNLGDKNVRDNIDIAKLKHTSLEEKNKVDQLYPELYRRATGITGGLQDGDEYLQWRPLNKYHLTKDGVRVSDCEQCGFEEQILGRYQNKGYASFETWIGTSDAKPFIYDTIQIWIKEHPEESR